MDNNADIGLSKGNANNIIQKVVVPIDEACVHGVKIGMLEMFPDHFVKHYGKQGEYLDARKCRGCQKGVLDIHDRKGKQIPLLYCNSDHVAFDYQSGKCVGEGEKPIPCCFIYCLPCHEAIRERSSGAGGGSAGGRRSGRSSGRS